MTRHDQLSDYLLGELPADEARRFEAALAEDAELRAEVERLRPVVGRLEALEPAAWEPTGSVPPLSPPPAEPEPLAPPAPEPARRPFWRRPLVLRPGIAAGFAVVLLALGVGAGLLVGDGGESADGRQVVLAPVEPLGGSAKGTATFASRDGEAKVRLSGLPPSREGEFYKLWLLNSADDLVALGSFKVPASGKIDVTVPVPGDPGRFAAIDVSVEPGDGNPAHSTRSVLRAPLAPS